MMKHLLIVLFGVTCGCATSQARERTAPYKQFRYTGVGVPDLNRDKDIINRFNEAPDESSAVMSYGPQSVYKASSERMARIRELEDQVKLEPQSRAETLRLKSRKNELAHLKGLEYGPKDNSPKETEEEVVVLVDTLPPGIQLRDGQLQTQNKNVEILGHFVAETVWNTEQAQFLGDVRSLGKAAKGNLVILSFLQPNLAYESDSNKGQGLCRGGSGYVVRYRNYGKEKNSSGDGASEL
jgi:hypothetical protein